MSATIHFRAGQYSARAASQALLEFGSTAAFAVCDRELFISRTLRDREGERYWLEVRATLAKMVGESTADAPDVAADPEEGTRLVSIFCRIHDPSARQRVLAAALDALRAEPV